MTASDSSQIRFRHFRPEEEDQVVDLWNRCLTKDPMARERFFLLFLLDPNFVPETISIAESDGRIVGVMQGIHSFDLPNTTGWITFFFVDPEFRRRGIAQELMRRTGERLRENGCTQISCNGYAPLYAFPGVDVDYQAAHLFLESMGFAPTAEPVAMELDLRGVQTPQSVVEKRDALAAEGVWVGPYTSPDSEPVIRYAERCFPYWISCLMLGLSVKRENVFVAAKGDQILGTAQWENPETDPPSGAPGRFGPFGVDPDLRGNGLGAVLFYTLVEHVKARGAERLWFGWAGGRNLSFYQRAGCRITRQYKMYKLVVTERL